MFFVYRKVSNIFQGSNHDQHDIINHDHDHETPTGFIKVDNQIIFTQKFAKKPIQIYESMVNVLKQLKDTKRVNEILKNEFHERKNHDKKRPLPLLLLLPFNEFLNFLTLKNMEELAKNSNCSNIFCVLNFGQIMIGTPRKT